MVLLTEDSVLGITIAEKLSPVDEKVLSSTPVMRAPADRGECHTVGSRRVVCVGRVDQGV